MVVQGDIYVQQWWIVISLCFISYLSSEVPRDVLRRLSEREEGGCRVLSHHLLELVDLLGDFAESGLESEMGREQRAKRGREREMMPGIRGLCVGYGTEAHAVLCKLVYRGILRALRTAAGRVQVRLSKGCGEGWKLHPAPFLFCSSSLSHKQSTLLSTCEHKQLTKDAVIPAPSALVGIMLLYPEL